MITTLNIGISGVARSGKNTFTDLLQVRLKYLHNVSVSQFALADALKDDCCDFVKSKLNLNVYSNNTEEKTLFRPLLVWYGKVKRKQTIGRYWTKIVDEKLLKSQSYVNIISDIRYDEYEYDETQWIKNKGILIHLSKFDSDYNFRFLPPDAVNDTLKYKKIYTSPANEDEMINDTKLFRAADYRIEWQDQSKFHTGSFETNEYMCDKVDDFILQLKNDGKLL